MATAILDGIEVYYETKGSGSPLLMFAPGGFDATLTNGLQPAPGKTLTR